MRNQEGGLGEIFLFFPDTTPLVCLSRPIGKFTMESRLDAPRPFTLHHYFKPRRQLRSTVVHRGAFCHRVIIRSTVFFLLYFIVFFFLDSLCIITNYFVMYLQSGDQFGSVRRW